MTFSRSLLTLTAAGLLTAGFILALDHKKTEVAPATAAATAPAAAASSAPACNMPCCAHASGAAAPCPMTKECASPEACAAKGSAASADCPCCGKAGAMACAHDGSAPMACPHMGSGPMACAHGSAPMKCAHHDSAAMAAMVDDASAPAAGGMKGCKGMAQAESAPAATAAPAPARTVVSKRKGDGVKNCPVSGEAVDPTVEAVINGRKVKFCCPKCIDEAKADAAAFIGNDAGVPAK